MFNCFKYSLFYIKKNHVEPKMQITPNFDVILKMQLFGSFLNFFPVKNVFFFVKIKKIWNI